ncbi:MAG: hypothetical protein FD180_588 [Planctomycetota bacterium]|nr:MAG: hypothetical protein FD180_588 [Planctomycetota bacterium]
MDPLLEESLLALQELAQALDLLERASSPGGSAEARLAALVSQAGVIALPAARELDKTGPAAANDLRDGYAQVLRKAAILNLRQGGSAEMSVKWQEEAAREARSDEMKFILEQDRNDPGVAMGLMDVAAMAREGRLGKARGKLLQIRAAATSPAGKARIQRWLDEPRLLMAPINSAPPLFRINGFGVGLYGRSSCQSDGTYVSTLCLSALFIPVFPLTSYVVCAAGEGTTFFGRVPLTAFARWARGFSLAAVALLTFLGVRSALHDEQEELQKRDLARAEEFEKAGKHREAVEALYLPTISRNEKIRSKAGEIARAAAVGELDRLPDANAVVEFVQKGVGKKIWSWPRATTTAWFGEALFKAVDRCLDRVAWPGLPDPEASPDSAAAYQRVAQAPRDLIDWARELSPAIASRPHLQAGLKFCARHPWPPTQAAVLAWHEGSSPPSDLVASFGRELERKRYPGWKADALVYLGAASAEAARPVLLLRARDAWLGREAGADLLPLRSRLPAALLAMLDADAQESAAKRLPMLEAAKKVAELEAPQDAWHAAGIERRLAVAYSELNDADPEKYPFTLTIPHAIASAEAFPDDGEMAALAMQGLLGMGEPDRAISIGERSKGVPGTRIWLGVSYARAGRSQDAINLLSPFVNEHFPPFVAAWQAWEKENESLTKHFWEQLNRGIDQGLVKRLNALPEGQAQEEATAWVQTNVDRAPKMRELAAKIREHADARIAARELAMVRLSAGRALPPGQSRKTELAEAERLFRDLRKVSGGDDGDDLALVQVFLWLGRNEEADALIDKLEKSPDGLILTELGDSLREVGRTDAAARILEKAWATLPKDPAKSHAAALRALVSQDSDDELLWLGRCQQDDPYVATMIAETKARKLMEEGKAAEAVPLLKQAAAYWEKHTDQASSLNNAGVNYETAFLATGDPALLRDAMKSFRKALALNPENPLLTTNAVASMAHFGWSTLTGTALRVDVLQEMPSDDWGPYIVPAPDREDWRKRVSAQPELREAADLGERAALLAPDQSTGFSVQMEFASAASDVPRLKRLREALEASPPAFPEAAARNERLARKEYTPDDIRQMERAVAFAAKRVTRARAAGHAPTLAYALKGQSDIFLRAVAMGVKGATTGEAIVAAEEALKTFDTSDTRDMVTEAHAWAAADKLEGEDPEFKAIRVEAKYSMLALWAYARKNRDVAGKLAQWPEVHRMKELSERSFGASLETSGISDSMALELAGSPRAAEAAKVSRERGTVLELARIHRSLSPRTPSAIAWMWAVAVIHGDREVEALAVAEAARAGSLKRLLAK